MGNVGLAMFTFKIMLYFLVRRSQSILLMPYRVVQTRSLTEDIALG